MDEISLNDYLDKVDAGKLIRSFIYAGYLGEYGLESQEQTSLHFLLVNFDEDLSHRPLDIFSDEHYHILVGNEKIVQHLCQRLPGQLELGSRPVRVRRPASTRIELTFDRGGRAESHEFDFAVITVPFPALREVELDESLELPDWKRAAIAELDNGSQAKLMLSFVGQPWRQHHSNGASYSDLLHHQVTWAGNPANADRDHGFIVH